MRVGLILAVTLGLCVGVTVYAQFGHPLKGTWSGDWGPNKDNRSHILLELNWDGKAVTGTINPGPDAVPLQKATLDPSNWGVHFEADGKDGKGGTVHYVIDGKLENIGSHYRVMSGTWTQGNTKGDFRLTRN